MDALCAALLEAFPNRNAIDRLLAFELEASLEQIAGPGNLKDVTLEVVRWAQANGRIGDLLDGARRINPGNEKLQQVADALSNNNGGGKALLRKEGANLLGIQPTSFKISIMGAERCIIEWHPKETDATETALERKGIDVRQVKLGLATTHAALLQMSPGDVEILPGEPSEVMPGVAYRLSDLGVHSTLYDSYHLYVRERDITVSLFKVGNYIPKMAPDKIGIDWQTLQNGLAAILFELYKRRYDVRISEVKMVEYSGSEWHYGLNYLLRDRKSVHE